MKRAAATATTTGMAPVTTEDRIALAINRIYDRVALLHGAADPPSDMELRQSADSNTWQIRAYRYGGPVKARDFEILHEEIERCAVFRCVQGHRVYFNSGQCSSQTETYGALVVQLCMPPPASVVRFADDDDEPRVKRNKVREDEDG